MSDEGDSDDDASDSENMRPDDELIETALNLLLSILEGNVFFGVYHRFFLADLALRPNSRRGYISTIDPNSQ